MVLFTKISVFSLRSTLDWDGEDRFIACFRLSVSRGHVGNEGFVHVDSLRTQACIYLSTYLAIRYTGSLLRIERETMYPFVYD